MLAALDRSCANSQFVPGEEVERFEDEFAIFAIYVDDRDLVRSRLGERGIGTGIHYPVPIHLQEAHSQLDLPRGRFTVAERGCDRELSLPIDPELAPAQVAEVGVALADVTGAQAGSFRGRK